MQILNHFYCSELKGHRTIEKMSWGVVSAGSENVREKKSWRKRETERSLRPHNVCFLSVSSVWPILDWRRTLLCGRLARVFCLELLEGQLVARPRCGAPQEDDLSRSLLWPRFPARQNHQLFPNCSSQACVLISAFQPAFFPVAICLTHLFSPLVFYSSSAFAPSLPSPPHSAGFMSLLPLLISPHLEFIDHEPGKPALPHWWSLWYFLCLRCLGKTRRQPRMMEQIWGQKWATFLSAI